MNSRGRSFFVSGAVAVCAAILGLRASAVTVERTKFEELWGDDYVVTSVSGPDTNEIRNLAYTASSNVVDGTVADWARRGSPTPATDLTPAFEYTRAVSNKLENSKQDKITDLEDIRSGAAAGATAAQKTELSAAVDYTTSVSNRLESDKQDKLVSGLTIKTINYQSLLGSGNIDIQGGGGGGGGVDTNVVIGLATELITRPDAGDFVNVSPSSVVGRVTNEDVYLNVTASKELQLVNKGEILWESKSGGGGGGGGGVDTNAVIDIVKSNIVNKADKATTLQGYGITNAYPIGVYHDIQADSEDKVYLRTKAAPFEVNDVTVTNIGWSTACFHVNGRFFFCCNRGIITSEDGVRWDKLNLSGEPIVEREDMHYAIRQIVWTGTRYVATGGFPNTSAGGPGSPNILTSSDGLNWTAHLVKPAGSVSYDIFENILEINGTVVAPKGQYNSPTVWSEDGIDWSDSEGPWDGNRGLRPILGDAVKSGDVLCTRFYDDTDGATVTRALGWTDDGRTWQLSSVESGAEIGSNLLRVGQNLISGTSRENFSLKSLDHGKTWVSMPNIIPAGREASRVFNIGDRLFFYGYVREAYQIVYHIWFSDEIGSWYTSAFDKDYYFYENFRYDGEKTIAVHVNGGGLCYSPDFGTNWVLATDRSLGNASIYGTDDSSPTGNKFVTVSDGRSPGEYDIGVTGLGLSKSREMPITAYVDAEDAKTRSQIAGKIPYDVDANSNVIQSLTLGTKMEFRPEAHSQWQSHHQYHDGDIVLHDSSMFYAVCRDEWGFWSSDDFYVDYNRGYWKNIGPGGSWSLTLGEHAFAYGNGSIAAGYGSLAAGWGGSIATGRESRTFEESAHAEGEHTTALSRGSHAEGYRTWVSGEYSHAEGYETIATNTGAHAEGYSTSAYGPYAHAEGGGTTASGLYSHAEGESSQAEGEYSHAEGEDTYALGRASHAEGYRAEANGDFSHAAGEMVEANGYAAFAGGIYAAADSDLSFVWSGDLDPREGRYADNGEGTFNVNPVGGFKGFYVGKTNLYDFVVSGGGAAASTPSLPLSGVVLDFGNDDGYRKAVEEIARVLGATVTNANFTTER